MDYSCAVVGVSNKCHCIWVHMARNYISKFPPAQSLCQSDKVLTAATATHSVDIVFWKATVRPQIGLQDYLVVYWYLQCTCLRPSVR